MRFTPAKTPRALRSRFCPSAQVDVSRLASSSARDGSRSLLYWRGPPARTRANPPGYCDQAAFLALACGASLPIILHAACRRLPAVSSTSCLSLGRSCGTQRDEPSIDRGARGQRRPAPIDFRSCSVVHWPSAGRRAASGAACAPQVCCWSPRHRPSACRARPRPLLRTPAGARALPSVARG